MYAIIEDSGTQIKVAEGDVLDIDLREGVKAGDKLTFERVLMISGAGGEGVSGSGGATLGSPFLSGATVAAEIIDHVRGAKIDVIKFRRRKGYRRKVGHRQSYLRVKITGISA